MPDVNGQKLRVLIVEDEPLIAADLELLIGEMGHEVIGPADSLDEALSVIEAQEVDVAFVDLNLRDGFTGLQIASALVGRPGAEVYFLTGNADLIPPDRCGARGVIAKPYTEGDIATALTAVPVKASPAS